MVLMAVKSVAPGLLFLIDIAARCVDIEKAGSVNNERFVLWLCSAMLSLWDFFARLTLKAFGGQWIAYIKR